MRYIYETMKAQNDVWSTTISVSSLMRYIYETMKAQNDVWSMTISVSSLMRYIYETTMSIGCCSQKYWFPLSEMFVAHLVCNLLPHTDSVESHGSSQHLCWSYISPIDIKNRINNAERVSNRPIFRLMVGKVWKWVCSCWHTEINRMKGSCMHGVTWEINC